MKDLDQSLWGSLGSKAIVGVVLVGGWQILSLFFPYYMLPGVLEIIESTRLAIFDPQFGSYTEYVSDTFRRLFIGFFLSVGIGSVLGTLMGMRENVEAFLRSWVLLGLSLPALAVAFAAIIIIGISEWVPVLTVTIIGIPFVMLNMWEGAQDLDSEISEMVNFFGADRYQKIRHVLLPQQLQYLFPSMYWGLVVSWKVLFVAEVFGAGSGIGYMVNYWFAQQRVDMLLGWIILPMFLVILLQVGVQKIEERLITWQ